MSGLTTNKHERTYFVAIDAWNTSHDVSAVKAFIKENPLIADWWNYVPYVFILVSSLGADELSDALKPYTKDAGLLVVEAALGRSQGLLPKSAWDWIDRRAWVSGLAGP
jgi:hypothetical protein